VLTQFSKVTQQGNCRKVDSFPAIIVYMVKFDIYLIEI
jgi:hypothetical protein